MKKQIQYLLFFAVFSINGWAQSISFVSFATSTTIGTNLTVNYKYTIPADGQIACGISLLNDWTYVSFVGGGFLNPAVAGTDVTGTFNILIPNGTTPTASLTGLHNYKINIELKNAAGNWLAGDYPATQLNFTTPPITPAISFVSFATSSNIGTNLTVNYKYTIPADGQVACGISLLNDWTFISFVGGASLIPAVAGTDVTGTFNILIPNGTTPTASLTGLQNYKINIELKNAAGDWLAGNYPATQLNFILTATTWTGASNTTWNNAANWSNGVPDVTKDVIIASASNQPIIASNESIKSLQINTSASLTVNTGFNLTVSEAIANNGGILTINNNANLFQGGTTNANTGNITIKRDSNALSRLDYTIWSSPVANQNLLTFSPATTITRFSNYNQATNQFNVIASPATTSFSEAAGYLIRMPNDAVTAPITQTFTGMFTGVPNNGTITKAIEYSGISNGYNLVGNPYPSTINADTFINDNTANIENSLYFWRKINGSSGSGYAVYNPMGGTMASASSEVPNGIIQVGQGFFVKAKSASNITFTNAMRVANNANQFFRIATIQKDRLWLNLTNTSGVFSQTLVGFTTAANQGIDMFDAKYFDSSTIALTSAINNEEYTIQGRPTFNVNDEVALHFKTDVAGNFTIALSQFDGIFAAGQDVFLVDNSTGIQTNLKIVSYTFTTTLGNFSSRFKLKFQNILNITSPVLNENSVFVYKNNEILYVNSESVAINKIQVYDIQGRLVSEQNNVNSTSASIKDLKAFNQVLIFKITGVDNSVVIKKIIN